jgi:Zn-dependent protease
MSGRWIDLLYVVPIILVSLTVHEVSHGWIAYRMGDPTAKSMGRLSLNPLRQLDPIGTLMLVVTYLAFGAMFGWAKPIPVSTYYFKNRQRGMAIVGAAGPVANFLLAVVFGVILRFVGQPLYDAGTSVTDVVLNALFVMVQINIVLGIFNLIPIPPLDGSRVLGAFLPRRAYEYWVAIDRYAFMIFIFIFIALRGPLGSLLHGAIAAVWHVIFVGSPLSSLY